MFQLNCIIISQVTALKIKLKAPHTAFTKRNRLKLQSNPGHATPCRFINYDNQPLPPLSPLTHVFSDGNSHDTVSYHIVIEVFARPCPAVTVF